MKRLGQSAVAAFCALLFMAFAATGAFAERRVALVIGNSKYANPSLALSNPRNDADDVTAALRDLGFEVVHSVDATKRDFEMTLARFGRLAAGADAALFFYAGHALQYQGRNYLMPIDGELEDEFSLRYQMESTDDVRAALDRAAGVKIMILDACRNNPAADLFKSKQVGTRALNATRGLARVDRAQGIVVSYATSADDVALDGGGRNSPYTTALLRRLKEPGLEVEIMFRRIAADVNAQTEGRQRPETYVSLIAEYYLNQKDRAIWDSIKAADDPAVIQDFIVRYPTSINVRDAQARLRAIDLAVRDRQKMKEEVEREMRARQEETQRTRIAGLEREQQEREAAQRRQEEELRAKAEAEKKLREQQAEQARLAAERTAREAAQRRQQEEAAAKAEAARKQQEYLAALAQQKKELEADQRRRQDESVANAQASRKLREQQEQQARLAAAERQRDEREAVQRRQQEEVAAKAEADKQLREQRERQARVAALEREQKDREATQRRQQTEQGGQVAVGPATAPQGDGCQQDEARLARLRAAPERDAVIKFERELTCARLRAQVVRLRESVGGPEISAAVAQPQPLTQPQTSNVAVKPSTEITPTPAPDAESDRQAGLRVQQVTAAPDPSSCKRDEERLARLRASRSRDEISKFERELGCEKLRPQVLRLRESLEGN